MEHWCRKSELNILIDEQKISKTQARFTLVMGRRRIGITYLIRKSLERQPHLYLLAMNEAEGTLCRRFQNQIEIDMVALESINHRIRIAETKMQKGKVSIPLPQDKARKIQPHFKHYQVEYVALSLEDL